MKLAVTILVTCVGALLALGLVMLYSSSMAQTGAHDLVRQLTWCAPGLLVCVLVASLDYTRLRALALPAFVVAVILLAAVLVFGVVRGNARRWFSFGGMSFQPSEFCKLALILALAWYGERYQRHIGTFRYGILIPGFCLAVVLALIFREPDVGTTILLAALAGGILLVAGVRWRFVLPLSLVVAVGVGIFLWFDDMRRNRILSWQDLDNSKDGVGYQAYQGMLALGSGGIFGLGLGDGRQKLGFIPEHHTDFIFSVIGEELGLVATMLVVVAFVAIVLCGLYISLNAREPFGLLLGSGITFLIGLQAFINLGVVTSALPNKGLPLPFISYGGSSLVVMLAAVGLMLSIARHAQVPIRPPANPFESPIAP
ncbi:MAG TPA: putative lipid II flippase FtsW [Verrucomicrobiota bacterium]|nr:MAG: Lipid II flippase FtsW [Verrucomicrobia bacterium ADurb.Bin118]HPY30455.1 putative lipid II flippase FtsW [Verrucomicrobiota bacterium]HQB15356.1 putative lipid II flippase FtsW [Verrucomicrobiota bacterium]